jgi:hypothetical protein
VKEKTIHLLNVHMCGWMYVRVVLVWQVRLAVLSANKTLLTPQPRLRTGFFSTLHIDTIPQVRTYAYLGVVTRASFAGVLNQCNLQKSMGIQFHGT